MKKKLLLISLCATALITISACANPRQSAPPSASQSPPQIQDSQGSGSQITSLKAREIAVEFVGHGYASDVVAFSEGEALVFEVEVRYGSSSYLVSINADNGSVIGMIRHEAHPQPQTDPIPEPEQESASAPEPAQTPESAAQPAAQPQQPAQPSATPPAASGNRIIRPSNPAISLERAIEIAYADLAARGISATYRSNSGMDWERGQWVWELLFRTQGERMPLIEFYINVDTGAIVKFEWDD